MPLLFSVQRHENSQRRSSSRPATFQPNALQQRPSLFSHSTTKETWTVCYKGHCILRLSVEMAALLLLGARLALDEHTLVAGNGLGTLRLCHGSAYRAPRQIRDPAKMVP